MSQSTAAHGLAGCSGLSDRGRHAVRTMSSPLVLFAAGQDTTPTADVEALADEVRARGTDTELHVYPDAVHSFFDRRFEQYQDEGADAWRRMLDFIERHG